MTALTIAYAISLIACAALPAWMARSSTVRPKPPQREPSEEIRRLQVLADFEAESG